MLHVLSNLHGQPQEEKCDFPRWLLTAAQLEIARTHG